MNTKFSYLYRDASNYKSYGEVVLAGVLTHADIQPCLRDNMFFVPSEVGLLDLQEAAFSEDDHIWHEIDDISATDAEATITISASTLLRRFKIAHQNEWNEGAVFERRGLL